MKRDTVCCCSFNDSPVCLSSSSKPPSVSGFQPACVLGVSPGFLHPVPWAHLHSNTSWLALGPSLSTASGMCWTLALLQSGEKSWHPFGAMRTRAGIKNIKDTEQEPLCSPVTGHELSIPRRWPSPSLAHLCVAGMLPHSGFAERGDVAVAKLLKTRGA